MNTILSTYRSLIGFLSGKFMESIGLLLARIALAGVFWRSYSQKVVEGTWLQIDPFQYDLFRMEFGGLPLPVEIAVPVTTYAELVFPVLLLAGLFTRFSALALMIMAIVIQLFVFPTSAHFFGWAITIIALALMLISRGGGYFSLDRLFDRAALGNAA